jgi:Tol biopolymer transport system component
MSFLAPGWTGPLLLAVIAGMACDSTGPGTGGSTGDLALATSTAGIQPDGDGYTIMVDGTARGTIGANDRVTVAGISTGSHAVELSDIEFNCATLGQFTRTVSVASDAEAAVDYSVACDAAARSRIAVVRDAFINPEVLVMNADGSEVTSLTDSLGAVFPSTLLSPVSSSADGSRVAFTRADGALYATTADGTGVIQLAPAGTSPLWSEDGSKVAFLSAENLYVAESDGSAVVQVGGVPSVSNLLWYDFAANGSLLVYEHPNENQTDNAVIVVRPDGTGEREIPTPRVSVPQLSTLSPDGGRIAYFASPDAQSGDGPGHEIYVSRTDGTGGPINVSNSPRDDSWPVWSPDGTRIAYVSSAEGAAFGRGSIRVVNADGTGQITITPDDLVVFEPAWSPDGTRIAYSGVVGASAHVFVANADGSGRADVTPNLDGARPTWTGH